MGIQQFVEAIKPFGDYELEEHDDYVYDKANGYFSFSEDGDIQAKYVAAYWNRTDGKKMFIFSYDITTTVIGGTLPKEIENVDTKTYHSRTSRNKKKRRSNRKGCSVVFLLLFFFTATEIDVYNTKKLIICFCIHSKKIIFAIEKKNCQSTINKMKIKKLSFKNHITDWNLTTTNFNKISLFVGASGVGKTEILDVLMGLKDICKGDTKPGWDWEVEFSELDKTYKWTGEFSTINQTEFLSGKDSVILLKEKLTCDNFSIFDKNNENDIIFNNIKLPKLDSSKSIISLLKEEESLKCIFNAWNRLSIMSLNDNITNQCATSDELEFIRATFKDVKSIKTIHIPTIDKLFLLYKNKAEEFQTIKQTYKEIFPLVQDIGFEATKINNNTIPILKIKEKSVEKWIRQPHISSGMFRTLMQIVMLTLADNGDVILIDEFENSLGINCIDKVADLVINQETDVQFIITSHHPYIINNIPFKNWKIVTRNGSNISVSSPEDLHIGTHSKHDAFLQLVQTDAYKTGRL